MSYLQLAPCTLPWGGTTGHGTSVTAYSATSVACGGNCSTVAQTRTCNDGTLSGTVSDIGDMMLITGTVDYVFSDTFTDILNEREEEIGTSDPEADQQRNSDEA